MPPKRLRCEIRSISLPSLTVGQHTLIGSGVHGASDSHQTFRYRLKNLTSYKRIAPVVSLDLLDLASAQNIP